MKTENARRRIKEEDVRMQLQRLFNIARHNFVETDSDVERTYQKGQMNAIKAVAISFSLEVL